MFTCTLCMNCVKVSKDMLVYQNKLLLHLKTPQPHELHVDVLCIQNCCLNDNHCKFAYVKVPSVFFFDVLLTVHLSIFISVLNQL